MKQNLRLWEISNHAIFTLLLEVLYQFPEVDLLKESEGTINRCVITTKPRDEPITLPNQPVPPFLRLV
ncbi:MAG: hypothetical protein WCF19_01405 [Chlamydiales bacterium]